LGLIAVVTIISPWGAPWSMDEATYLEMTRGIVEHGLPYTEIGEAQRFRAVQVPWNVVRDGRSWGIYPPLFPYFAAPFYLLGGPAAVVRANLALLGVLALGVFLLARLLSRRSIPSVVAAYVVVLGTPCAAFATLPSSFVLTETLLVWSCYCALRSASEGAQRAGWWAALAGLLGGLAAATHLLAAVALAAVIAALALGPQLRRAALALAGAALPLTGVALLNALRFGSFNPLSYGPCVWPPQCSAAQNNMDQTALKIFLTGAPVIALVVVAWIGLRLASRWRVAGAAMALITVAVLVSAREHLGPLVAMGRVAAAYLVDAGATDWTAPYRLSDPGPGVLFGGHVLKSVLQAMPMLWLALLASKGERRVLALVLMAVFAALTFRGATLQTPIHLGVPILHMRYVSLVLPLAVILAVVGASRQKWSRGPLVAAALLTAGLGLWLSMSTDQSLLRRVFLLRVTLLLGLTTLLFGWLASRRSPWPWALRAAPWLTALAFGAALAINLSVDLPYFGRRVAAVTRRAERIAAKLPAKAAIVANGERFALHALAATRDVVFAEPAQARSSRSLRELVRWWSDRGRAVYAVLPPGARGPRRWGLGLALVDRHSRLYRVLTPP
jgi:hypothetical protein